MGGSFWWVGGPGVPYVVGNLMANLVGTTAVGVTCSEEGLEASVWIVD